MSNPTSLHKPYKVGAAFTGYEITITTDNGVPTAGDASVYNVKLAPLSGVRANVNRFGPLEVMIKGRFTGTDKVNADCQVALWQWDRDSEQSGTQPTVSPSLEQPL